MEPQHEHKAIEGKFTCEMCEAKVYSSIAEGEKNLPLSVNKAILKKLEAFEHMIPVTCDEYPQSYISWYNRFTHKVVSVEAYMSNPGAMSQHVPIERKDIDDFFT